MSTPTEACQELSEERIIEAIKHDLYPYFTGPECNRNPLNPNLPDPFDPNLELMLITESGWTPENSGQVSGKKETLRTLLLAYDYYVQTGDPLWNIDLRSVRNAFAFAWIGELAILDGRCKQSSDLKQGQALWEAYKEKARAFYASLQEKMIPYFSDFSPQPAH